MSKVDHKRDLVGLLIYIVIFGIILIASVISYFRSSSIIDFGLPAQTTDLLLGVLSIGGLVRAIWHASHY